MSWLARMELSRDALARCRFRDAYAWHQAVWDCFPGRPDADRDFLTRMDWLPQGCRVYLLCLSEPVRPTWCPAESWAVKVIAPSFLQHERYTFDLLANPTRKVASFDAEGKRTPNGRRLPLMDEASRLVWMQAKASQHGFRLEGETSVENAGVSVFRRQERTGTHAGVRFRGRLQVTDRERFIHAFHHGIGSAKAFGYGMLLLQPLF